MRDKYEHCQDVLRLSLLAAGLMVSSCSWAAPMVSGEKPTIVFAHVNVVPMNSQIVLPDQTVVVRNGLISQVGPAEDITTPNQATVIDGSGRFLMPGLTDAHVHLDVLTHARPDFGDGPLFLAYGVTTVLNLRGSPQQLEWRRRIQAGDVLAPNLYTAGEFINEPLENSPEEVRREVMRQKNAGYDVIKFHEILQNGRYVTTHGLSRPAYDEMNATARSLGIPLIGHSPDLLGLQALLDNHQSLAHAGILVPLYFLPKRNLRAFGALSVAALAMMCFASFVLLAAAMATRVRKSPANGGSELRWSLCIVVLSLLIVILWPGLGLLSGSLVFLTILTAVAILMIFVSLAAMRVWARAWRYQMGKILSFIAFTVVLAASVAFIAGLLYWIPIAWRASDPALRILATRFKQAGIAVEPTLVVYKTANLIFDGRSRDVLSDPAVSYVAPPIRKRWQMVPNLRQPLPARLTALLFRRTLSISERTTLAFQKQGVDLILGTDTLGIPLCIPGKSAHDELELLVESGLTPYEALRTATINPARFLRKESEFGTVEIGKRADLLLLTENPLQSIHALDKPIGVMVRGQWLSSEKLMQLLDELRHEDARRKG